MKKNEIFLNDWKRILFGEAPEVFLVEVFYRTLIIYIILLIILRLMGKRMGGQLSISELSVMLTLGAIISAVMQLPDKGLLQGVTVLFCAIFFQRGINYLGVKSSKAERFIQGSESLLACDGYLILAALDRSNISRQQLFGVLRNGQINNLGEVERIYLEASGLFSIYKFNSPKPGLSLLPGGEELKLQNFDNSNTTVCTKCGIIKEGDAQHCINCHSTHFQAAVVYKMGY